MPTAGRRWASSVTMHRRCYRGASSAAPSSSACRSTRRWISSTAGSPAWKSSDEQARRLLTKVNDERRNPMSAETHNRRVDDMSADEVKEFWHGFCERKGVDDATRARGDAKIERDPNYWADQTMVRLLDSVST